jgi:endoglucanase
MPDRCAARVALSAGCGGGVTDKNNASDGDILIACALARAGTRWQRPAYTHAATYIARDILTHLVRDDGQRTLLLPGSDGFETADATTINPSYYLFFALAEIEPLAPSPLWASLRRDGLQRLVDGRFGRWRLPPDWLEVSRVTGTLQPAGQRPARFSYDAVRVPLNLAWARLSPPGVMGAISAFWDSQTGRDSAWVDLRTGLGSPYAASGGMKAVRQIATSATTGRAPAAAIPRVASTRDYYSASLTMLTRLAWSDRATAGAGPAVTGG